MRLNDGSTIAIRNDVFENVPAAVRAHVANQRLPKAVIARDLIRENARRDTHIPVVDIYINKPGLAAITPTALMYKSTTRNSLMSRRELGWPSRQLNSMAVAKFKPRRLG